MVPPFLYTYVKFDVPEELQAAALKLDMVGPARWVDRRGGGLRKCTNYVVITRMKITMQRKRSGRGKNGVA